MCGRCGSVALSVDEKAAVLALLPACTGAHEVDAIVSVLGEVHWRGEGEEGVKEEGGGVPAKKTSTARTRTR